MAGTRRPHPGPQADPLPRHGLRRVRGRARGRLRPPPALLAGLGVPLFVATSYSKSFALYGERIGALSVVTADPAQATLVAEKIRLAIRTNYSTPPTHGALLVSTILTDPVLRARWEAELDAMRDRVRRMRIGLAQRLEGNNVCDFSRLTTQRGLFSYSGLSPNQMERLRTDHAVYGVSDGRLCMSALTENTLDRVSQAIRTVL